MWNRLKIYILSVKTYRANSKTDNHQCNCKYPLLFNIGGVYIIFLVSACILLCFHRQVAVSLSFQWKFNAKPLFCCWTVESWKKCSSWWISVIFDPQLSSESHINNIDKVSYYHLRNITRLRQLQCQQDAELLTHAFTKSRLDYCNLLLAALPDCSLHRVHFTQN